MLFGVEMFVECWIGFFIGVALFIVGLLIILLCSSLEVVGVGTVVSVLGTLLSLFTLFQGVSKRDLLLVWSDLSRRLSDVSAKLGREYEVLREILEVLRGRK